MKVLITFGQIHVHSINGKTLDKDCVASIHCETYEEGRKKAFEYFDGKFHNCYDSEKAPANLMEYFPRGIIEI